MIKDDFIVLLLQHLKFQIFRTKVSQRRRNILGIVDEEIIFDRRRLVIEKKRMIETKKKMKRKECKNVDEMKKEIKIENKRKKNEYKNRKMNENIQINVKSEIVNKK